MRYLPADQYQRYMEYRNSRKAQFPHGTGKKRFYRPDNELVMALDAMTKEIAEGKIILR